MERTVAEGMRMVEKVVGSEVNKTELMDVYGEWAKLYDDDIQGMGYEIADQVAETAKKYARDSACILDVACGTGLVGQSLRRVGFGGRMHGVDGCKEMIDIARSKGTYNELFQEYLKPGLDITVQLDKYDLITCAGAMTNNHLDPLLVQNLFEVLKSGGVFVFSFRESKYNKKLAKRLWPVLDALESSKNIRKLEGESHSGGLAVNKSEIPPSLEDCDFTKETATRILCYQKL